MELQFLERNAGFEEAKVCLLPVPYEGTVCFMEGTSRGPQGIMHGSLEVEEYEMELGFRTIGEGFPNGFHLMKPVETKKEGKDSGDKSAQEITDEVEANVSRVLEAGKFPVVMGGEHSVSVGAVRAAAKKYPGLCILHIDAHADLRNEYEGDKYSHACAMRRILESEGVGKYAQVGVRSISKECAGYSKKSEDEGIGRMFGSEFSIGEVLNALGKEERVYISIDLDGFDPSIVPGVGTPHPGGLGWEQGLELLREVAEKKKIVGFDIVELAPIKGQVVSEIFAAKLLYKLIGYSFFADRLR